MDFDAKVAAILASADRAEDWKELLDRGRSHSDVIDRIATGLSGAYPSERAWDIAFHVSDWIAEAACLVALHVAPDKFSDEEVQSICEDLSIHAINHVMAATVLQGENLQDVFELGLRIED